MDNREMTPAVTVNRIDSLHSTVETQHKVIEVQTQT